MDGVCWVESANGLNVVSNRDHIFVIRGEREWKEDLVAGGRAALPRHTPYRQGGGNNQITTIATIIQPSF